MNKETNTETIVADMINKEFVCDENEKVSHQTNNNNKKIIEGGLPRETFITSVMLCDLLQIA